MKETTTNKKDLTEEELLTALDKLHIESVVMKKKINNLEKAKLKYKLDQVTTYHQEQSSSEEQNNDNQSLEDEINFYYENLKECTTKEEIMQILPSNINPNYTKILLGLKLRSIKNIRSITELIEETNNLDKEDLKWIKETIKIEEERIKQIDLCLTPEKQEEPEMKRRNKLIFASTDYGNVRIFRELKNMPSTHYAGISTLLESIENNNFKNVKQFLNPVLSGVAQVKDLSSATRVVFKKESSDTYVIISAFTKKVNKSTKGYLEPLMLKISTFKEQEATIKEKIQDENYLLEQEEIRQKVYDILQSPQKESEVKTLCKKK